MGDQVGGLSTAAAGALCKSPTDTLDRISRGHAASTEVYRACRGRPRCNRRAHAPSTPLPRLFRSKVSVRDLQRAQARCSIRPLGRSKLQVAACSRGDASHGLFVTSPCRSCKPPEHAVRCFRSRIRLLELPHAPDSSCTAQPRARGSKFQLNPSSWARAVPQFRACAFAPCCQSTWSSRCRRNGRTRLLEDGSH